VTGRRLTWLDVFTATPLAGNGLAVVHDADGVPDEVMLAFARETRLSETTFVQAATAPGADYRNRIWTTFAELPFAGHPSLGTAVAVAHAAGPSTATYVQETGAGLQPIDVAWADERRATASMLQERPAFGPELDRDAVTAALGLSAGDADPSLPPQVVSTGLATVLVPVYAAALDRIAVDAARFDALLSDTGATTVYAFSVEPGAGRARARARARCMFPGGEDPATGSAAGPVCAYLDQRTGGREVVIEQGTHMGRPSELRAAIEGDRVRVSGEVVVIAVGEVWL
jgi:trans-2,3-dihydro-3-hydroxyanthranilate isomerase